MAGPLFSALVRRVGAAGVAVTGAAVAYYDELPDVILVHAAIPVTAEPGRHGFAVLDLVDATRSLLDWAARQGLA